MWFYCGECQGFFSTGPLKCKSVLCLNKMILMVNMCIHYWSEFLFFQYNGADTEICVSTTWSTKRAVPGFILELHPLYPFPGRGFYHIWTYETIPAPQLIVSFRRLFCKTTLSILKCYCWINYLKFFKKSFLLLWTCCWLTPLLAKISVSWSQNRAWHIKINIS